MSKEVRLVDDENTNEEISHHLGDAEVLIDEAERGSLKTRSQKRCDKPRVLFESTTSDSKPNTVRKQTLRSKDLTSEDLKEREAFKGVEDIWDEKQSQGGSARSPLAVWVSLLVLACISAGVVWSLTRVGDAESQSDQNKEQRIANAEKLQAEIQREIELNEKHVGMIKGFFEGETLEEKAKWCRNPEATLLAMKKHYQGKEVKSQKVADTGFATVKFIDGQQIKMWSVKLEGQKVKVPLLLARDPEGEYALDWETMVCYQPFSWEDFIDTRDSEAKSFRLNVVNRDRDGFYGFEFSDDKKYSAYKVFIRGKEGSFIWAYAERGGAVDKAIKKQKGVDEQMITMYLKLRFPKDAQSGECVHIDEVVSTTWFKPDED